MIDTAALAAWNAANARARDTYAWEHPIRYTCRNGHVNPDLRIRKYGAGWMRTCVACERSRAARGRAAA